MLKRGLFMALLFAAIVLGVNVSGCDSDGAQAELRETAAAEDPAPAASDAPASTGGPAVLLTNAIAGRAYAVSLYGCEQGIWSAGELAAALWNAAPVGGGATPAGGVSHRDAVAGVSVPVNTYGGGAAFPSGPFLALITEADAATGASTVRYKSAFSLQPGGAPLDWNTLPAVTDARLAYASADAPGADYSASVSDTSISGANFSGASAGGANVFFINDVAAGSFVTAELYAQPDSVSGGAELAEVLSFSRKAASGRAAGAQAIRLETPHGGLFTDSGDFLLAVTEVNPMAGTYRLKFKSAVRLTDGSASVSVAALTEAVPDIRPASAVYHAVSFNSTGGSPVSPVYVPEGGPAPYPADPAMAGMAFGGWYADSALTIPYGFGAPVNAAMTLYAKWSADFRTVRFVSDGIPEATLYIAAGHTASPPAQPSRPGNSFEGWYADSGFARQYNFKSPVFSDMTLHAKLVPLRTVTFDTRGGAVAGGGLAAQSVKDGNKAIMPQAPAKDGRVFEGWYRDAAGLEAWDFAADSVNADITLYAKWAAIPLSRGISIDVSGTSDFPDAYEGYPAPHHALPVTVRNIGSGPTGGIDIAVSGPASAAFALSATRLDGIALNGGTASFTVEPERGLAAGTYLATVTVAIAPDIGSAGETGADGTGDYGTSVYGTSVFEVRFTVYTVPEYGISLNTAEARVTMEADANYATPPVKSVGVSNIGTRATGDLLVSVSDRANWTLSTTSIRGIEAGGSPVHFTVAPKAGLAAGTYNADVTVGASSLNSSTLDSRTFTVSFTVNPAIYGIGFDTTGTHIFPEAPPGYAASSTKAVGVSNTGNQPTGSISLAVSGANPQAFGLSAVFLSSIPKGGSPLYFTVYPMKGLEAGIYTATVTAIAANGGSVASLGVSFMVSTYGIELDVSGNWAFTPEIEGYTASVKTVAVRNWGNKPTGSLTVSVSNAEAFSLSTATISAGIEAGGNPVYFTVAPNEGLSAGYYSATVTVSAASQNITPKSFTVSFTVTPAVRAIALDTSDVWTFPELTIPYTAPAGKAVSISNTGNKPTGSLTVSVDNAEAFSLSHTVFGGIEVGGSPLSFTVTPKSGLAAGTHTATVTVSGPNVAAQTFGVSFKVNPAHTYTISLDFAGTWTFPSAVSGYGEQAAKTITVRNTGNQPTGSLSVSVSNAQAFSLSASTIGSIAAGGTATFSVRPRTGLTSGVSTDTTYTAAVTVSGANIAAQDFTVSFTVTRVSHAVTFDLNGAPGNPPTPLSVKSGLAATPPENPQWSGRTFGGWYRSPEDAGSLNAVPYDFNTPVTGPLTLYARWYIVISFVTNGGTAVPAQTLLPGSRIQSAPVTAKGTSAFGGWYLNSDLSGSPLVFPMTFNDSATLYARW